MHKGNVNVSLKTWNSNMSSGILPVTEETLHLLELKHPDPNDTAQQAIIQEPI